MAFRTNETPPPCQRSVSVTVILCLSVELHSTSSTSHFVMTIFLSKANHCSGVFWYGTSRNFLCVSTDAADLVLIQ